jgi:hypothetical protein
MLHSFVFELYLPNISTYIVVLIVIFAGKRRSSTVNIGHRKSSRTLLCLEVDNVKVLNWITTIINVSITNTSQADNREHRQLLTLSIFLKTVRFWQSGTHRRYIVRHWYDSVTTSWAFRTNRHTSWWPLVDLATLSLRIRDTVVKVSLCWRHQNSGLNALQSRHYVAISRVKALLFVIIRDHSTSRMVTTSIRHPYDIVTTYRTLLRLCYDIVTTYSHFMTLLRHVTTK